LHTYVSPSTPAAQGFISRPTTHHPAPREGFGPSFFSLRYGTFGTYRISVRPRYGISVFEVSQLRYSIRFSVQRT
jgi:hypothetical protein